MLLLLGTSCLRLHVIKCACYTQDAEELIKAVPGLTDGYYHKVKLILSPLSKFLLVQVPCMALLYVVLLNATLGWYAGFCSVSP